MASSHPMKLFPDLPRSFFSENNDQNWKVQRQTGSLKMTLTPQAAFNAIGPDYYINYSHKIVSISVRVKTKDQTVSLDQHQLIMRSKIGWRSVNTSPYFLKPIKSNFGFSYPLLSATVTKLDKVSDSVPVVFRNNKLTFKAPTGDYI